MTKRTHTAVNEEEALSQQAGQGFPEARVRSSKRQKTAPAADDRGSPEMSVVPGSPEVDPIFEAFNLATVDPALPTNPEKIYPPRRSRLINRVSSPFQYDKLSPPAHNIHPDSFELSPAVVPAPAPIAQDAVVPGSDSDDDETFMALIGVVQTELDALVNESATTSTAESSPEPQLRRSERLHKNQSTSTTPQVRKRKNRKLSNMTPSERQAYIRKQNREAARKSRAKKVAKMKGLQKKNAALRGDNAVLNDKINQLVSSLGLSVPRNIDIDRLVGDVDLGPVPEKRIRPSVRYSKRVCSLMTEQQKLEQKRVRKRENSAWQTLF